MDPPEPSFKKPGLRRALDGSEGVEECFAVRSGWSRRDFGWWPGLLQLSPDLLAGPTAG